MNETLSYSGTLIVSSCWCGIAYAMPKQLYDSAHQNGQTTYCPLGHAGVYKNTENERLKKEAERLRQQVDFQRAQRESAERAASAARGQATKLRKRIEAGVCPHCTRHFTNVERHIATKHPETKAATA